MKDNKAFLFLLQELNKDIKEKKTFDSIPTTLDNAIEAASIIAYTEGAQRMVSLVESWDQAITDAHDALLARGGK